MRQFRRRPRYPTSGAPTRHATRVFFWVCEGKRHNNQQRPRRDASFISTSLCKHTKHADLERRDSTRTRTQARTKNRDSALSAAYLFQRFVHDQPFAVVREANEVFVQIVRRAPSCVAGASPNARVRQRADARKNFWRQKPKRACTRASRGLTGEHFIDFRCRFRFHLEWRLLRAPVSDACVNAQRSQTTKNKDGFSSETRVAHEARADQATHVVCILDFDVQRLDFGLFGLLHFCAQLREKTKGTRKTIMFCASLVYSERLRL